MNETAKKAVEAVDQIDASADPIWESIRAEVKEDVANEPVLATYLYETVLIHSTLEEALSSHLANLLESPRLPALTMRDLIDEAFRTGASIGESIREDIKAVYRRDPAARGYSTPLLYFKGFQALQAYRVAHYYWNAGRESLALYFQSRVSQVFAVDIHPAARIGHGILMDHATSIVIGETAVVENDVSMLHEVTLGGTGKETGDRHPKIRHGVLISAGAKILGNVEVGEGAKIGGGAVVLSDVPPHTTFVGVPAKAAGRPKSESPAFDMDHTTPFEEHENGAGI